MDVAAKLLSIESLVKSLFTMVQGIQADVQDLKRRVGNLEVIVEDIKDILGDTTRAVDINSVIIVDHEQRIRRLEVIRA